MTNNKNLISAAKKFYENKNFFEAKMHLLMALKDKKIDKKFKLSLYVLIADVSFKLNEFENAKKYLLKSVKGGKFNSEIFNSLGNIYLKTRDYLNSEKYYLKSLSIEKENEVSLINLAIFYHNFGQPKKAIFFYKKILKLNKKNIGALYNLSNIDKSVFNKETLKSLKYLIAEKKLNNFNLAASYFLLSNFKKIKKNFSQEISFLKLANDFSFKANEKKNDQLNNYWLKNLPEIYKKFIYIKNEKNLIDTNNLYPIFIIGLPRSGSTLIESIISSTNERLDNLGETNLVNWAFLNSNRNILETFQSKNSLEINLQLTSKKVIDAINNLRVKNESKKILFTEKSLENFFYIDLILNIFPNAKFIHSKRNLVDNVFAIYNQFLPKISWSHSFENILLYIDNYLKVIDFFKKKYPDRILTLSLENFTVDPKKSSIKIFEFCNFKWNEDCLNFYKRKDLFIDTASNNQMRSDIKKYDEMKYKPYKELLTNYIKKYNWLRKD